MSIRREEVLHVARLAEIEVREHELDRLVSQLNRIVDYVAQLNEVPAAGDGDVFIAGPEAVRLRDDVVGPVPLARPPAAFAPGFRDGFFTVPRHGAMEDQ